MEKRRVVVTGMGILSPLGRGLATNWSHLMQGRSGAAWIEHFATDGLTTRFAGMIPDYAIEDHFSRKDTKKMDAFICYAIDAAEQAITDAGICFTEHDKNRMGIAIGSGIGGLQSIQDNTQKLFTKGARSVSPFFVPGSIINMAAGNLAIRHGLYGPNIAAATACTTSTHMIGLAARTVMHGDADVMLAGGADDCDELDVRGSLPSRVYFIILTGLSAYIISSND